MLDREDPPETETPRRASARLREQAVRSARQGALNVLPKRMMWVGAAILCGLGAALLPLGGMLTLGILVVVGGVVGGRSPLAFAGLQAFALAALSPRFTIGGVGITPVMMLGLACLALWLGGVMVSHRSRMWHTRSTMAIAALLYSWVMLASYASGLTRALLAPERTAGQRAVLLLAAGVGVTLLVSDGVLTKRQLDRILGAFLAGMAVLSAFAILEFVLGYNLVLSFRPPGFSDSGPGPAEGAERLGLSRVSGTASHPIEAGTAAAAALPIALHYAYWARSQLARVSSFALSISLLCTMLMSLSRSAILGLLVALLVMFPRWGSERRFKFTIIAVLVVVGGIIVLPDLLDAAGALIADFRGEQLEGVGVSGRTDDYATIIEFVRERPFLGLGFGTYTTQLYYALDNQYANLAVETGLIGLVAFVALLATGWGQARRVARQAPDPAMRDLATSVSASIAVFVVTSGTFDLLGFHVTTAALFLMLGVAGALTRIGLAERRPFVTGDFHHVRRRQRFDPDRLAEAAQTGQVVSGTRWGIIAQVVTQVTRLTVSIVLARLLAPEDFGIVILGFTLVQFLDIFKDLGTAAAVVQRAKISQRLLSSMFFVNVGVAVGLATLFSFATPWLAASVGDPSAANLLRVMSVTLVISSMGMIHQGIIRRQFLFQRLASITVAQAAVNGVVAISSASAGAGAWALVYGQIAGVAAGVMVAWWSTGWRPSFEFDLDAIRSVSSFSINLTLFNVFAFMVVNADKIVVGRFLGPAALGYYGLGQRVLMYPVRSITKSIQDVLFPTFARLQDNDEAIRRGYLRAARGIALVAFPMMAGFTVVAGPFVRGLLSEKWVPAIPVMTILAPVGLLHSLHFTVGAIYQAKGRTDKLFHWGVIAGTFTLAAYFAGLPWGINGVATAYAISVIILTYPAFAMPFKLIDLPVRELARSVLPYARASLVMVIITAGVRWQAEAFGASELVVLFVSTAAGALVYGGWVLVRRPPAVKELLLMLRRRRDPSAAAAATDPVADESVPV